MRSLRELVLVIAVCLIPVACTSGGDGTDQDGVEGATVTADPSNGADPTPSAGTAAASASVQVAAGVQVDVDDDLLQAAQTWITTESGLSDMLQEELFLSSTTQTQDVVHLTFVQQHDDVAVRGAQFIVHIRQDGQVIGASQSLTEVLPGGDVDQELAAEDAADIAVKAVPGQVTGTPQVGATWLEVGTELRLGWEALVATTDPPSNYAVVVDATTGEVLSVDRLASDHGLQAGKNAGTDAPEPVRQRAVAQAGGCDAPEPPSACIYVVDPIYASGDPSISPQAANSFLTGVQLRNLLNPLDGNLVGRFAQIAAPIASQYADPDNVFGELGRGGQDITFEAAMTYYWIDYTQGVLGELGFDYHADDPVDFVPIEPQAPNNAFYLFVEDRIHMGDAPDGVREAEDAQGTVHEYGHALLQAAVPNIVTEEGGAFHEGFADLVSVFTTVEFRNGDVGCLFHWAERGECIRRIDTDLTYPDDLTREVHLDAQIYTGAVWDVFEAVLARDAGLTPADCQDRTSNPCDAVRNEVYATLLSSLPFLTPALDLNDAAAAFAASDEAFFDGRNATIIQQAFSDHGLTAQGSPGVQVMRPGTLMDLDRSDAQVAVKIQHSFRGDLQVDVGVVDPAGTVLCELSLLTPNGEDSGNNVTGRFDLTGTDCADQLPPSADRLWVMRVRDAFAEDEGTLFQFVVAHNGVRFVAPGLPQPIPDADTQGVLAVIGEGLDPAAQPMADQAPEAAGTGVEADIQISHPYIGDLSVQVAVVDPSTGSVQCRVDVRAPDPQDAGDDLAATVDLSACAGLFPPSPDRVWLLRVIDTAAQDVGTVDAFVLRGPDGADRPARTPVDIPDDDSAGVLLLAP